MWTRLKLEWSHAAMLPSPPCGTACGMNLSVMELGELGVKRISLGSNLFRTAFGAALRGAQEILNDGTFGYAGDAATFKEISALFDD